MASSKVPHETAIFIINLALFLLFNSLPLSNALCQAQDVAGSHGSPRRYWTIEASAATADLRRFVTEFQSTVIKNCDVTPAWGVDFRGYIPSSQSIVTLTGETSQQCSPTDMAQGLYTIWYYQLHTIPYDPTCTAPQVYTPVYKEPTEECTICLEKMTAKDPGYSACKNKHVYHARCILTWFEQHKKDHGGAKCPLCKQRITWHDPYEEGRFRFASNADDYEE